MVRHHAERLELFHPDRLDERVRLEAPLARVLGLKDLVGFDALRDDPLPLNERVQVVPRAARQTRPAVLLPPLLVPAVVFDSPPSPALATLPALFPLPPSPSEPQAQTEHPITKEAIVI